jgi:hypothetical protein
MTARKARATATAKTEADSLWNGKPKVAVKLGGDVVLDLRAIYSCLDGVEMEGMLL